MIDAVEIALSLVPIVLWLLVSGAMFKLALRASRGVVVSSDCSEECCEDVHLDDDGPAPAPEPFLRLARDDQDPD